MKIILWNSGTELISHSDISSADPLRFILPEDRKILDARVSDCSHSANLPELACESGYNNDIKLSFDYLGVREGVLISILHTGDRVPELKVQGTVKGFGSPTLHSDESVLKYLTPIFLFLGGIASGFYSEKLNWYIIPIGIVSVAGFSFLHFKMKKKTIGKLDKKFEDGFTHNDFT